MSFSAKIFDDSIFALFVVGLVQIHPRPIKVSRNLFQQQASVRRISGAIVQI